ncbi:MAG: hypothetical protein JO159_15485 [Acidobacteria bacterium]|nr:hypothetical protein [Acidobacteriota bacterium]
MRYWLLRSTKGARVLAEDPKWELAILATVQGFYVKLLEEFLRGEVPVPSGLEIVSPHGDQAGETLARMRRWMSLLDLAITPAMLRRAFTEESDPEIAEAMLRYFVGKKAHTESDRDKTDMVATFLYRHPRVPGQWEQRGYGLDGSLPISPFEIALLEILADSELPPLPEPHLELLRRFDALEEEVLRYRDFQALLGSGIIQKIRELKHSLEDTFFHPGVLATVARCNATIGARFANLFRAAAREIKTFAHDLAEEGGIILGSVDGVDVTVEQVRAFDENGLLALDYGRALEKFHRVSKLKQAIEGKPLLSRSASARAAAATAETLPPAFGAFNPEAVRKALTSEHLAAEEAKLLKVEQSVIIFVRVADPKFRQVVPMRFFNLTLTPAEAEACAAEYLEEKSLRAGVARVLVRLVAVTARIISELEELKRAGNSPSLWKLHAQLLVALLVVAEKTLESAERVCRLAAGRGHQQEVEDVRISLKKLTDYAGIAERTLARSVEAKSATAGAY